MTWQYLLLLVQKISENLNKTTNIKLYWALIQQFGDTAVIARRFFYERDGIAILGKLSLLGLCLKIPSCFVSLFSAS